MNLSRRGLFGLGAAFIAAPAIVRVASIMPIKPRKTIEQLLAEAIARARVELERQLSQHLYQNREGYSGFAGLVLDGMKVVMDEPHTNDAVYIIPLSDSAWKTYSGSVILDA